MDIWKGKQINQNYTSDICKYISPCVLVNTDQMFREVLSFCFDFPCVQQGGECDVSATAPAKMAKGQAKKKNGLHY